MTNGYFKNEVDVVKYQRERLTKLSNSHINLSAELDDLEKKLQLAMQSKNSVLNDNKDITLNDTPRNNVDYSFNNINFEDLLKEAHKEGYKDVNIYDVATEEEVNEANKLLTQRYHEFSDQYKLDKYDYAIAGIIGSLAALMDYFMVTTVKGTTVSTGKLKNVTENFWNSILSPEKIKQLEDKYRVTYDISLNSSKISQEVLGLCPMYHRFQSLGHDPIIGFVFGVSDLMKGQLTAIDSTGRLIIQSVSGATNMNFIESIITVFGHFLSDVGTRSKTGTILSVPAPFTPLLQLIQTGSIKHDGKFYTIGDLSKKMYNEGYNFNHFIGMSLPVILIEILTRLAFVLKEFFYSKKTITFKNNPKLTTMLCIANSILFAENAGKLAITKNPMAINYVSWIKTAQYGFKTLKWNIYDKGNNEVDYAQGFIDLNWQYLELSSTKLDTSLTNSVHLIE